MKTMKELRRHNFKQLLKRFQKDSAFAAYTGMDTGMVSQYKTGYRNLGDNATQKLEADFKLDHGWFDQAHGEDLEVSETKKHYGNVTGSTPSPKSVALVSAELITRNWENIGAVTIKSAKSIMINTAAAVSDGAFALKIFDDTMSPRFPLNSIIIVDPEKEPSHGSFVVAYHPSWPSPTFKKLSIDAGKRLLIPENNQYPPIPIDDEVKIIGRVIAASQDVE